jgi:hypothetical protein
MAMGVFKALCSPVQTAMGVFKALRQVFGTLPNLAYHYSGFHCSPVVVPRPNDGSLLPNVQKSYVKEPTLERMGKDEYQINDFFKAYVNEKVGPDSRFDSLTSRPGKIGLKSGCL